MKLSQLHRLLKAAQPEVKDPHPGRQITRRDLLAQGLLGFSGTLLLNAVPGFRGGRAYAAPTRSGVICIDLAGGATIGFSFPPISPNREPLPQGSLATLGIPRDAKGDPANEALDYSLGIGMNPASHMLAGIKQVASPEALAKVNGYLNCVANRDDSRENEHSPMHTLMYAGYAGSVVNGVGTAESPSGGNSTVAAAYLNPIYSPVVIRSVKDAINTVLPETLSTYFDRDTIQEVFKATQRWSVPEQAAFRLQSTEAQVSTLSKMMDKRPYEDALAQISKYTPDEIDLTKAPNLSELWTTDQGAGSIVKMVSDGMAACGTLSMGGYDYHNNGSVTCNDKDFAAGLMIGRVIEHFHRVGKNLMLCLYTDGGTAAPKEGGDLVEDPVPLVNAANQPLLDASGKQIVMGGPRVGPTGDSGGRGMRVTLFANNTGAKRLESIIEKPSSGSLQIGGFKMDGSVDNAAVITGESPALGAMVDIYNLMSLDGLGDEFAKKFANSPIAKENFKFFERWG